MNLWQRQRGTMIIIVLTFLVLGTVFTFIQEFKYEAKSKVLLIQNFPAGTDPYKASKSNEFLANVLASVMEANSFYLEVMNTGFNINSAYFGESIDEQVKTWEKTIVPTVVNDSGIIEISIFHPERVQADQIIRAVNMTMKNKHQDYHGMGDDISLRVIDQPITSQRPTKPNVPLNLGLSLLFGLAVALIYIYLFPEEGFAARVAPEKEIKYSETEEGIKELEIEPRQAEQHLSHRQVEHYQSLSRLKDEDNGYYQAKPEQAAKPDPIPNEPPVNLPTQEELSVNQLKKKGDIRNVLGS